jgi:hypothetical protein
VNDERLDLSLNFTGFVSERNEFENNGSIAYLRCHRKVQKEQKKNCEKSH